MSFPIEINIVSRGKQNLQLTQFIGILVGLLVPFGLDGAEEPQVP
jgi:hypothetical protein